MPSFRDLKGRVVDEVSSRMGAQPTKKEAQVDTADVRAASQRVAQEKARRREHVEEVSENHQKRLGSNPAPETVKPLFSPPGQVAEQQRETREVRPTARCARCGHAAHDHQTVNYSDGQMVARSLLICPTAIFSAEQEP